MGKRDECGVPVAERVSVAEFRAIAAAEKWDDETVRSMTQPTVCTIPFFIGYKERRRYIQLVPDAPIKPLRK